MTAPRNIAVNACFSFIITSPYLVSCFCLHHQYKQINKSCQWVFLFFLKKSSNAVSTTPVSVISPRLESTFSAQKALSFSWVSAVTRTRVQFRFIRFSFSKKINKLTGKVKVYERLTFSGKAIDKCFFSFGKGISEVRRTFCFVYRSFGVTDCLCFPRYGITRNDEPTTE